jgi:hypothetical protein
MQEFVYIAKWTIALTVLVILGVPAITAAVISLFPASISSLLYLIRGRKRSDHV